jgi:hypothetical protein
MEENILNLLIECKLQLEYLNGKFKETGTSNAIIAKLNSAIQNMHTQLNDPGTKEVYILLKDYDGTTFSRPVPTGEIVLTEAEAKEFMSHNKASRAYHKAKIINLLPELKLQLPKLEPAKSHSHPNDSLTADGRCTELEHKLNDVINIINKMNKHD